MPERYSFSAVNNLALPSQEVQLLKSEAMQLTRESDIFRGLHKSHEVLFEEVRAGKLE